MNGPRLRILFITPTSPYPLTSGGAIRNYGILRGLSERGHQVTLFTVADNEHDLAPLLPFCDHVETVPAPRRSTKQRLRDVLVTNQPDIARRLASPVFTQRLLALLAERSFDLVQIEGLEVAHALPIIREIQPDASICYDAHNAEAALQRTIARIDAQTPRRWIAALYSAIQAQRLWVYERQIVQEADLVITVSDEDADLLRQHRPDHIAVMPNGINTAAYTSPDENALKLGSRALVFTGKMDYRPNVDAMRWFGKAIFPLIPDATLTVVGRDPHPSLQQILRHERIHLTGWVASIPPYLHAATVFVVPLRMGSGTRLKILEAMAAGCAIVATSLAASGLNAETRNAIVLADQPQAFADAVTRLLDNPEQRQNLGHRARRVVQDHYDWSMLLPRLWRAYEEANLG